MTTFTTPPKVAVAAALMLFTGLTACSSHSPDSSTVSAPSIQPSSSASSAVTALRLTVAKGKGVGGVKELKAKLGSQVEIIVTSSDTTSEIHLHGYDLKANMAPGQDATITFNASIGGVFEIELEGTSVKIADLTVR